MSFFLQDFPKFSNYSFISAQIFLKKGQIPVYKSKFIRQASQIPVENGKFFGEI